MEVGFLLLCLVLPHVGAKPYSEQLAERDRRSENGVEARRNAPPQFPSDQKAFSGFLRKKETDEKSVPGSSYGKNPCTGVYCHSGRVCRVSIDGVGSCVCAPHDYCEGHRSKVCGSDGIWYPSHCELHRMACVKQQIVHIDHGGRKCRKVTTTTTIAPTSSTILPATKRTTPSSTAIPVEDIKDDFDDDEEDDDDDLDEEDDVEQYAIEDDYYEDDEDIDDEDEAKEKTRTKKNFTTPIKTTSTTLAPKHDESGTKANLEVKSESTEDDWEPVFCFDLEHERFKANLLNYHCQRIEETNCLTEPAKKQFVSNVMFNYYDRNSDQKLSVEELKVVSHKDHLNKLSHFCDLTDLLDFDDTDEDDTLSLTEFYKAFAVSTIILPNALKVFTTLVNTGNSVELKCDIQGSSHISWRRNGASLDDIIYPDIKAFSDGTLYINNLGLEHMGNYTCQDQLNNKVIQTHILRVQKPPTVTISPKTQFHSSGSDVTLRCHADGVPRPKLTWEKNEVKMETTNEKYHWSKSNTTLQISGSQYTTDTGAYKCRAQNSAGISQDIGTVFIENSKVPGFRNRELQNEVFAVFHDKGYTIYNPFTCGMAHSISGSYDNIKFNSDKLTTLCNGTCSWGSVVTVRSRFIYVSQPLLNRVVVIDTKLVGNPVEVISTDISPVSVQYVPFLDQVWTVCWNGGASVAEKGTKTTLVIRQASEEGKHHTLHTQPLDNNYDLINKLYLPSHEDFHHNWRYGYVTHENQQGLYKLDLHDMKYVKKIDLSDFSCVPKHLVYVAIGGVIVVQCGAPVSKPGARGRQLILDHVTDAILNARGFAGRPFISPDGRYLVTVDQYGSSLRVEQVLDDGQVRHKFEEYPNLQISSVAFMPSIRGFGYDLFATSKNKNEILYVNLESARMEMIEGVGQPIPPDNWPWSDENRVIRSGGIFSRFLVTSSKESVFIIDGGRRHIQCEFQDIKYGNVVTWLKPSRY